MQTKRWNLPYRNGLVRVDRRGGIPAMSLTLINKDEGTLHIMNAYGTEHIRHLADIFAAAADFAEGRES